MREGLTRLDAVVYTHHHADHIMGLDDTRVFYFRQQTPIPIYAEARCMATIRATFAYIFDGNYPLAAWSNSIRILSKDLLICGA